MARGTAMAADSREQRRLLDPRRPLPVPDRRVQVELVPALDVAVPFDPALQLEGFLVRQWP
jgi:hypothetical protein